MYAYTNSTYNIHVHTTYMYTYVNVSVHAFSSFCSSFSITHRIQVLAFHSVDKLRDVTTLQLVGISLSLILYHDMFRE